MQSSQQPQLLPQRLRQQRPQLRLPRLPQLQPQRQQVKGYYFFAVASTYIDKKEINATWLVFLLDF